MNTPAVVIKLGGELMEPARAAELELIARDLASLSSSGTPVVVVHGGGPQADALQKRLGMEPKKVGGRRITDDATLDVIKMAVAGQVNMALCSALLGAGARPIGLHGASSLAVEAKKRPPSVVSGGGPDPVDFGHVGDVTGVNQALLSLLVRERFIPVLACLGADASGRVFNINADTVANKVAVALKARALVLVTNTPGVLRDVNDPLSRIPVLTRVEGQQAIQDGVIAQGMIPKVEESFKAMDEGVASVLIIGKLAAGDLRRAVTEPGSAGTLLRP